MPSWFGSDLLLVGKAVLWALAIFGYTTLTGAAGFCILYGVTQIVDGRWAWGCFLALFSLAVATGIALLIITGIRTSHGLGDHLAVTLLAAPYVLGIFGVFFVPGEGAG